MAFMTVPFKHKIYNNIYITYLKYQHKRLIQQQHVFLCNLQRVLNMQ